MTETNTPSVEGDQLEQIARLIEPWAFNLKSKAINSAANPPYAAEAARLREEAFDKARQIAALPCKGGEDADLFKAVVALAMSDGAYLARHGEAIGKAEGWPRVHAIRKQCEEARLAMLLQKTLAPSNVTATPTHEPDTGRGLREAREYLEAFCRLVESPPADDVLVQETVSKMVVVHIRSVLAALSDTHETPEKQA